MKVKYLIQALVNTCDLEDEVLVEEYVPYDLTANSFPNYTEATGLEFIKDEEGKIKGVALY